MLADTKLANGETCVEMPICVWPDDDPFFEEPPPT
jgi:hypothetical protein